MRRAGWWGLGDGGQVKEGRGWPGGGGWFKRLYSPKESLYGWSKERGLKPKLSSIQRTSWIENWMCHKRYSPQGSCKDKN